MALKRELSATNIKTITQKINTQNSEASCIQVSVFFTLVSLPDHLDTKIAFSMSDGDRLMRYLSHSLSQADSAALQGLTRLHVYIPQAAESLVCS